MISRLQELTLLYQVPRAAWLRPEGIFIVGPEYSPDVFCGGPLVSDSMRNGSEKVSVYVDGLARHDGVKKVPDACKPRLRPIYFPRNASTLFIVLVLADRTRERESDTSSNVIFIWENNNTTLSA
jgi:hypothetical protein